MVENQTRKKIKKLKIDNGLEFVNEDFNKLCRDNGIVKHKTVRHTPQQNGLAEWMNKMILDKVRSMLSCSNLPAKFWAEAVHTVVHLINRTPSSTIGFQTPMEKWSGQPVDYSNLRVFGCLSFVHVRNNKLQPRAIKCLFLGYLEGIKGYKIWNLTAEKCIISNAWYNKKN